MSTNEAQIPEGHRGNLFFNEPGAVLGSISQRAGYQPGDGMKSANVVMMIAGV
jgi:hypothetical protein